MPSERSRTVTHDGDTVRIDGKPIRMDHMVRDAFWAGGHAIVLLYPETFLDEPGGARKRPRDPVRNLRAFSPSGELRWEAEQPELEDYYYIIESREPLVALSFSAYRCDLDVTNGRILSKTKLK